MSKYHDLLGVKADASKDDIKKAYRKMAGKHHPDKGGDEAKFKEVQEAYERLTNPQKFAHERQHQYRQYHTGDPFSGFGGGDPNEIFRNINIHNIEELLRRHQQQQQMRMIRLHFELTLESTLHEQTKTIHVPEYNIPAFEITVPAGIRNGEAMRYSNIPTTDPNLPHINLEIVFIIRPDKDFAVVDHVHLIKHITVDALEAMVGTTMEVTTLEGTTLNVKIPAHAQNGQKLKIPGKGLKYKENPNIRGDLYVEILITVPHIVDEEEKKIINDLIEKRTK